MKHLDFVDILVMVLLCLVTIPIGYRTVVRQNRLYQMEKMVAEDKNVKPRDRITDGIATTGGEYTTWEVLLSTQIQDYYMPQPKSLSVMGYEGNKESYLLPLEITAVFEAERDIYISQVMNQLKRVGALQHEVSVTKEDGTVVKEKQPYRFILEFNPGTDINKTTDDFYYFKKVGD